jgi:hypothetical protein
MLTVAYDKAEYGKEGAKALHNLQMVPIDISILITLIGGVEGVREI